VKPKRFVILVPATDPGGIATFSASYGAELIRQGIDVLIVLWVDISSPYSVKARGLFEKLPTLWVEFDSLDKASEVARCLSSQLRLKNGDCIISQTMPWIGHIMSRDRTTKDVLHVEILHNNTAQYYESAKRLAPTCGLYCTVNNFIAKTLREYLNESDDDHIPVVVCSAGIEVPSRLTLSLEHRPFRFCFIGRFSQAKRIYDLILLAKYLVETNIDFEFSIIGGGNKEKDLKSRVKEIGAQERVHFLGFRPHKEVLSHLSKQHALVLTSAFEGGPIVVCEAMAHGVVPVATKVGICEDVISDGENGFLVEIGDVRTMADRLLEIAANLDLWRKMSHKAWKTAKKELAISARVGIFLKAVEDAWTEKTSHKYAKPRPLRNRSVLDHPFIPNPITRNIRNVWRLLKGRPSDAAPKISK
jgi:glycosyltransferase involved in cell wall biosynthesis